MKNAISLLLAMFFVIGAFADPPITVTATKKNGTPIASTTLYVQPENIFYVDTLSTGSLIGILKPYGNKKLDEYTLTEIRDTVVKRANLYSVNLVPMLKSFRDTTKWVAYNTRYIYDYTPLVKNNYRGMTTLISLNYLSTNTTANIVSTRAEIKARGDSIALVRGDIAATPYDTSTYTMKLSDAHIVMNSTTADTITLLNPSQFFERHPITISNIGAGATTLVGGFTVKDKSGNTVSSVAANTVMQLKAYYTGAAYIWLKEY